MWGCAVSILNTKQKPKRKYLNSGTMWTDSSNIIICGTSKSYNYSNSNFGNMKHHVSES